MTEYIQVDRDQLRVGMRFDYRAARDIIDGVQRTLTNLDPIEYDYKTSFGKGHAALTEEDTEGRTFWVHPDDLHVDEDVDRSEQEQWAGSNASGAIVAAIASALYGVTLNPAEAEALIDIVHSRVVGEKITPNRPIADGDHIDEDGKAQYSEAFRSFVGTYDEGVRDGYLKAQQEQGAEPTGVNPKRAAYTREDAIVAAIKALGGTPEAGHLLIPLAQQIERYVNGNDGHEAEESDDDLHSADQIDRLPVGTVLVDKDGDTYTREDGSAPAWRMRSGKYTGGRWNSAQVLHYSPKVQTLGAE